MSDWDTIINKPFGPYDLENIPSGFILDADFLNTFAEAIDEKRNVIYNGGSYTDRFSVGEIMTTSLSGTGVPASGTFHHKVWRLAQSYVLLFTSEEWVNPVMINTPSLYDASYVIGTSDIQALLNHPTSPVYNLLFTSTELRKWTTLTRADVWSGLYKIFKKCQVYKNEDMAGVSNAIIERRPIINTGRNRYALDSGDDSAAVGGNINRACDFRGVYFDLHGFFPTWPAEADHSVTEGRFTTSFNNFTIPANMTIGGGTSHGVYFGHQDIKSYDALLGTLVYERGEVGYDYLMGGPIELQCKRKSDGQVLDMDYSYAYDLTSNYTQESYTGKDPDTSNNPSVAYDNSYPRYVPGVDPNPFIKIDLSVYQKQKLDFGYGETTRTEYRYAPTIRLLRPLSKDFQAGFDALVDGPFQGVYRDTSFDVSAASSDVFVDTNNSELNYYIAP